MGEIVGVLFVVAGAFGLYRIYLGVQRGVVYYHLWSHRMDREEIRRDRHPRAFLIHVIVPLIINLVLLFFGLFELLGGDIFLI
jgi:hypothetical protein